MRSYQSNGGGKQSLVLFMQTALAKCFVDGRRPRRWEISCDGMDQLRYEVHPSMGTDLLDARDPFKKFMGLPIMEVRQDGIKCALIVDKESS